MELFSPNFRDRIPEVSDDGDIPGFWHTLDDAQYRRAVGEARLSGIDPDRDPGRFQHFLDNLSPDDSFDCRYDHLTDVASGIRVRN